MGRRTCFFHTLILVLISFSVSSLSLKSRNSALLSNSINKCNILCLSGGGSKGAYEAGVLKGLTETLEAGDAAYAAVSGFSVGAINALTSLAFPVGSEKEWAELLVQKWSTVSKENVYRDWPFGVGEGLLLKTAIYDNAPLRDSLRSFVVNYTNTDGLFSSDRLVSIGATNMESGAIRYWSASDESMDLADAALASSAIPGILPASIIDDTVYNDGGISGNMVCGDAVNQCIKSGKASSDADVVFDLVFCTSEKLTDNPDVKTYNSVQLLMRAASIRSQRSSLEQVELLKKTYPNAQIRFVIRPASPLPGKDLEFKKQDIEFMLEQGRLDATDAAKTYLHSQL